MDHDPDPSTSGNSGTFASAWDDYVARSDKAQGRWPGDEWGNENLWSAWCRRLFEPFGLAEWNRAVEIGQGAGKYTSCVLAAGRAQVLAIDVSARFQEACAERLRSHVESGRLTLRQIDERDPDALARAVCDVGWQSQVDAVYSIDTLVHLTATQIAALLSSASEVLRANGCFIGTFADATSKLAVDKLVADIDRVIRGGGEPSTGCFHWSSPELIRSLAQRFGYQVALCDLDPEHHRDGHFVLRLSDPAIAAAARALRVRS